MNVPAGGVRPTQTPPLAPLMLTVFIDLLGFGLTIPLLPYYAREHGATAFEVSLLSVAYSAMQFVFVPVWGALSDRIGRRPVLLTSIAATAVSMAMLGFARSYAELVIVRLIQGVATANLATAQAYIADVTTSENRARAMGLIGAAFGVGFILGPFFGGWLAQFSYKLPGLWAAGLATLNFFLAWARLKESLAPVRRTPQGLTDPPRPGFVDVAARVLYDLFTFRALRDALRIPGVGTVAALFFVHILAFTQLEATFALLLCDRFTFSARETGFAFALIGVVAAVVQGGMLGALVRRYGEVWLLRAGVVSVGVAMAAIALTPRGDGVTGAGVCTAPLAFGQIVERGWRLLLPLVVVSAGHALVMPNVNSITTKLARGESYGGALGATQSAGSLARVLGPALAGVLYDRLGMSSPYWVASLGMIAALGLALAVRQPPKAASVS